MNNRKELTRSDLESWGITNLFSIEGCWFMSREFTRRGHKHRILKKETTMKKKYVYAPATVKRCFTLCVCGQHKSIQLNRLLYAWFIGDIPEGMEVKGNPSDIKTLELITTKENAERKWTYLKNCKAMEDM